MDQTIKRNNQTKWNSVFVHVLLWGVIFILPYFFINEEQIFNWKPFLRSLPDMLGIMLVFYINYFVLIEKLLFKGKTKEYIICNIILIVGVTLLMSYMPIWLNKLIPEMRVFRRRRWGGISVMHIIRNSTTLFLITGLSLAFKMTVRWFELDNERKELAKAKSEAELQNIKNQINPHFLLNTLNNIYALIEFDPPKARRAVVDLSKLLRHLLYDNNQTYVPLKQEAEFLRNYLDLMRIRLSDNVELKADFSYSESGNTLIPPLIFISLLENSFKHGISGDKSSFINVTLKEHPDGKVEFVCKNSYFPKSKKDKSGSGIGLDLVKRRLELLYPGSYNWETTIENDVYSTVLVIDSKKLMNDTKLLDSRR